MAAVLEQHPEDSQKLRQHDLEQTLRTLCDDVARLVDDAREHGALDTREASLQLLAFEERRGKALQYLNIEHREPYWIQLGNLERLLETLDCSREFFAASAPGRSDNEISADPSALVR